MMGVYCGSFWDLFLIKSVRNIFLRTHTCGGFSSSSWLAEESVFLLSSF